MLGYHQRTPCLPVSMGRLQMSTSDPWGPTLDGLRLTPGPPRLHAAKQNSDVANRFPLPWQPPAKSKHKNVKDEDVVDDHSVSACVTYPSRMWSTRPWTCHTRTVQRSRCTGRHSLATRRHPGWDGTRTRSSAAWEICCHCPSSRRSRTACKSPRRSRSANATGSRHQSL